MNDAEMKTALEHDDVRKRLEAAEREYLRPTPGLFRAHDVQPAEPIAEKEAAHVRGVRNREMRLRIATEMLPSLAERSQGTTTCWTDPAAVKRALALADALLEEWEKTT
jgi:hypothetical protein